VTATYITRMFETDAQGTSTNYTLCEL